MEVRIVIVGGRFAGLTLAQYLTRRINLDAVPSMAAHAYTLRTVGNGVVLGNGLIGRFEQADLEPDTVERQ